MIRAAALHLRALVADERQRCAFWVGAYAGTLAAIIGVCHR